MNFDDVEEIKSDNPEEQAFHYYYNREERIAKAPRNVQEYYNGGMRPVRGIKVLFNKQNRFILLSLVLFVGAAWVYSGFNSTRAYGNLRGINFELTSFSYEEEVYVSLKMKRSKKSTDMSPANVTAEIFVIDPNNQVGDKQTLSYIYADGEEYLRTKFTDYDIIRVDVILTVGDEEKELSAEVKR